MKLEAFNPTEGRPESRNETAEERAKRVRHEVMGALISISCPNMENDDPCVNDWFENNKSFDKDFDQLLDRRPNLLAEWDSSDFGIRDGILDELNGRLIKQESKSRRAA
jgi:hypothetical protein